MIVAKRILSVIIEVIFTAVQVKSVQFYLRKMKVVLTATHVMSQARSCIVIQEIVQNIQLSVNHVNQIFVTRV